MNRRVSDPLNTTDVTTETSAANDTWACKYTRFYVQSPAWCDYMFNCLSVVMEGGRHFRRKESVVDRTAIAVVNVSVNAKGTWQYIIAFTMRLVAFLVLIGLFVHNEMGHSVSETLEDTFAKIFYIIIALALELILVHNTHTFLTRSLITKDH